MGKNCASKQCFNTLSEQSFYELFQGRRMLTFWLREVVLWKLAWVISLVFWRTCSTHTREWLKISCKCKSSFETYCGLKIIFSTFSDIFGQVLRFKASSKLLTYFDKLFRKLIAISPIKTAHTENKHSTPLSSRWIRSIPPAHLKSTEAPSSWN